MRLKRRKHHPSDPSTMAGHMRGNTTGETQSILSLSYPFSFFSLWQYYASLPVWHVGWRGGEKAIASGGHDNQRYTAGFRSRPRIRD